VLLRASAARPVSSSAGRGSTRLFASASQRHAMARQSSGHVQMMPVVPHSVSCCRQSLVSCCPPHITTRVDCGRACADDARCAT
jgi:hypothetical protein